MIFRLLTEHHLEFLSIEGGCRGLSGSTHVKIPHCWKSHALAHIIYSNIYMETLAKLKIICLIVVLAKMDKLLIRRILSVRIRL